MGSEMIQKPRYSTTKLALWSSSVLAWVILLAITVAACTGSETAVSLGNIAFPMMAALIASVLGIHRAFGSMDMRSMMRGIDAGPPPPPGGPCDDFGGQR